MDSQHLWILVGQSLLNKRICALLLTYIYLACQAIVDDLYPSESWPPHRRQARCPQRKLRETRRKIAGAVVEVVEAFNQEIVEVMVEQGLLSDNRPLPQARPARLRSHLSQILGRMERAPDRKEAEQLYYLHLEVEGVEEARLRNLFNLISRVHLRRLGEIH